MAMGAGSMANDTMAMPPSAMPMPMHKMKMMMHMTFFWGSHVDVLFHDWPGTRGVPMYLLALLLVFAAAFVTEFLSYYPRCRRSSSDSRRRRFSGGTMLTGISTLRTGLSYLVMLAVMSFNVGVLIAAVAGHAAGFFIFAAGVFFGGDGVEHNTGSKC